MFKNILQPQAMYNENLYAGDPTPCKFGGCDKLRTKYPFWVARKAVWGSVNLDISGSRIPRPSPFGGPYGCPPLH